MPKSSSEEPAPGPERPPTPPSTTARFEQLLEQKDQEHYVLCLFVTGMSERSTEAIAAITEICQERLADRYELEVVDIGEHADIARDEQIIAVPTLLRKLPLPLRRLIGNLSDRDRVLLRLDLPAEA